ncbi:MAG: hypothetical protein QOJ85_4412, partial [Solirubrobacteraceae bacterium]|nr:hypothetical protein [Solirubrobacteraceae bacterium]
MVDDPDMGTGSNGDAPLSDQTSDLTGRYIVVFSDEVAGDAGASAAALQSLDGVSNVASSLDFDEGAVDLEQTDSADATIFAELGVAVVAADPSAGGRIAAFAESDSRILAVEPERIQYAIDERGALSIEYVRGFRDGVSGLYDELMAQPANGVAEAGVEST